MLNVNETTKSAYTGSSTPKVLTISIPNRSITFTNSDLVSECMELTEAIENERYLTFKGCIASQVKFQVANVITDLRGEYIEAKIQAGETEEIPLFSGYVDTQDNQTHEDVITEFTCYDVLYKIGSKNMQSWIDSLTFPMTVKQFRDSLFSNLGIMQESVTLVNDALTISENVKGFLENPTAVELMRYICQMNARFGQIGRDGKFKYRKLWVVTEGLYPGADTFPSSMTYPSGENASDTIDMSQYSTIEYQPYDTAYIDRVLIYDGGGITEGDYGSGTNAFSISDNPLAFSVDMQREAQNLYNEVAAIQHIPIVNVECSGRPWLECGDIIMTATKKNIIRSYILSRTMKGIQALKDAYSSDSDKYMPEAKANAVSYINAERKKVLQIQADIVEIKELKANKATVDQLSAREATFENATAQNFSAVNGNINSLTTKVARVEQLDAQKATIAQLNATSASLQSLIAQKATIAELNAVNANLQSLIAQRATIAELNATSATLQTMIATKASITELNAVNAKFGSLNADNITSGTISADRLSASSIYTKFLNACSASPFQGTMYMGTIRGGTVYFYQENSYKKLSAETITINGVQRKLVGWS